MREKENSMKKIAATRHYSVNAGTSDDYRLFGAKNFYRSKNGEP